MKPTAALAIAGCAAFFAAHVSLEQRPRPVWTHLVTVPGVGRWEWSCDRRSHFSTALTVPKAGATEHVRVVNDGWALRSRTSSPGDRLTTPPRTTRLQVWTVSQSTKPQTKRVVVTIRFRQQGPPTGDCLVPRLGVVLTTTSHSVGG